MSQSTSTLAALIKTNEAELLKTWLKVQVRDDAVRTDLVSSKERRQRSVDFIDAVKGALVEALEDFDSPKWDAVKRLTEDMSRAWSRLGVSPSDTAMFVMSFKQAILKHMLDEGRVAYDKVAEELVVTTSVFDQLGLHVTAVSLDERDQIIARQREEVLELSTPVVEVWEGILVLPIIGVLDSSRTQQVMETLLQEIVRREAETAILDITGVPAVDSVTAQHIVKTVAAARLMGTTCAISGVRPQIAQTIVTLGVDLGDIDTHSSLRAALAVQLERRGFVVSKR